MAMQLSNRTKYRLRLKGAQGQEVLLAPFEKRVLEDEALTAFNQIQLTRHGLVGVEDAIAPQAADAAYAAGFWLVAFYVIAGLVIGQAWFWLVGAFAVLALVVMALVGMRRGWLEVARWIRQLVTLAVALTIGIGIPLAAVWYSTSLSDLDVPLTRFYELVYDAVSRQLAVARALQITFVAVASLLPALMYYLFDRARLATLRERFVHQIFRLDPALVTESDLNAKYGSQIEETFGSDPGRSSGARFASGRRSPVAVATLLITIGWTFLLLNSSVGVVTRSGGVLSVSDFSIVDLFRPNQSAVAFAFLGGYFYSLRVVLRGYVRGDLKPKTYTNITVRLISAMILAWVLEAIVTEPSWFVFAAAFMAGIVPDTWLKSVGDKVKGASWLGWSGNDELSEELSLTKLQGIDLYDRGRLEDEGVTNVEALAHGDLVDLMLLTRIPVPQLVDWVDQAILYLHTYKEQQGCTASLYDRLLQAGIRTATDLKEAAEADGARQEAEIEDASDDAPCVPSNVLFFRYFEPGGTDTRPDNEICALRIVLDTLSDEEWLEQIEFWRSPDEERTLDLPGTTRDAGGIVIPCSMIDARPVVEEARRDEQTSEKILREALRSLPEDPLLLVEYADTLYRQALAASQEGVTADYDPALQYLERALEATDSADLRSQADALYALILITQGRSDEARQRINGALKDEPNATLQLQLQFMRYAVWQDQEAYERVLKLLDSGITSPRCQLKAIVAGAESSSYGHAAQVEAIAEAICGQGEWSEIRKRLEPSESGQVLTTA